ncbi:MAG: VCBS repeat-containing protein [Phycisphaerales bacterium]|nr:VCBS repeat-containing protein [Phycisphaerales bacterium]
MRKFLTAPSLLTKQNVSLAVITSGVLSTTPQPAAAQCDANGLLIPTFSRLASVTGAVSVVAGDFDEDGFSDFATENDFSTGYISVIPGLADGELGAPVSLFVDISYRPRLVGAADLNRDGHLDLLVRSGNQSSIYRALLGDGMGNFELMDPRAIADTEDAALGQLNDDDIPDLLIVERNRVSVAYGVGDGTFGSATALPARIFAPRAVLIKDLDRDGVDDLLISDLFPPVVRVRYGPSYLPETASAAVLPFAPVGRPVVADFNRDGDLDVAVRGASGTEVSVSLGQEGRGFASGVSFALYGGTEIHAADLNDDAYADLLAAPANSGSTIAVCFGRPDGTLSPQADYEHPYLGKTGTLVDANHDGALDFVSVSRFPERATVWTNQCMAGLRATITPEKNLVERGSGVVLLADVNAAAVVSYQWLFRGEPIADGGPYQGANTSMLRIDPVSSATEGDYRVQVSTLAADAASPPANVALIRACGASDINADGIVDLTDLAELLSNFGRRCE